MKGCDSTSHINPIDLNGKESLMNITLYLILVIIISVLIIYMLLKKIQMLQKQYATLLENDKDFQIFITNVIKQDSNDTVCIKAINSKYHIGVLNSKLIFDRFKIN